MNSTESWLPTLFPITLGTAQLGMPYGKVIHVSPPPDREAYLLFIAAVDAGINCFDTARIYQRAESLIGGWLEERHGKGASSANSPAVISKAPPFPEMPDEAIRAYLDVNFAETKQALGLPALDGYLIHSARDFSRPGVTDFLLRLKAGGLARATGLSVYEPAQVSAALDHAPDAVDLIQAPMSLFDRRIAESGLFERGRAGNVTLFARSVFLQGVLYMQPESLPAFLSPLIAPIKGLRQLSRDSGHSLTALAIAGALADGPAASVVIGVGDVAQLEAAVDAIRRPVPSDVVRAAFDLCAGMPNQVLDPRKWPA